MEVLFGMAFGWPGMAWGWGKGVPFGKGPVGGYPGKFPACGVQYGPVASVCSRTLPASKTVPLTLSQLVPSTTVSPLPNPVPPQAYAGKPMTVGKSVGPGVYGKAVPGVYAKGVPVPYGKGAPSAGAYSTGVPGGFGKGGPGMGVYAKGATGTGAYAQGVPGAFGKGGPSIGAYTKGVPGAEAFGKGVPGAFGKAGPVPGAEFMF